PGVVSWRYLLEEDESGREKEAVEERRKTARRSSVFDGLFQDCVLFFPPFPCSFFAVPQIRSRRYQHYVMSGVLCRSDSPHPLRRENNRERPLL
ncbi:MAG: hypothetical protein MR562_11350, partial [Clostridiaceae bacterium]|nr:hypothetical protein [Clostridiaceae bacterium]